MADSTLSDKSDPTRGGLNAAISNRVVQLTRDYVGRGPTKARTFVNGDVVVTVLQDTLTRAERSLTSDGKGETVTSLRQQFQRTMRPALSAAVEDLTGRRVIAFLSDNHIEPDIAVEAFVLDGPVAGEDHGGSDAGEAPAEA